MLTTEVVNKQGIAMPRRRDRTVVPPLALLSATAVAWYGPVIETGTKRS
jgi:hypothetical protein